uniref:Uncharacterized protein n=1 Tax=Timema poppense TaxID=170557 RepID=A0A7R9HFB5_TIMPO|nr:unnamed protein product [Timema poppensis]
MVSAPGYQPRGLGFNSWLIPWRRNRHCVELLINTSVFLYNAMRATQQPGCLWGSRLRPARSIETLVCKLAITLKPSGLANPPTPAKGIILVSVRRPYSGTCDCPWGLLIHHGKAFSTTSKGKEEKKRVPAKKMSDVLGTEENDTQEIISVALTGGCEDDPQLKN